MSRLLEITEGIEAQEQRIETEDVLLLILRKDLGPFQAVALTDRYYMFLVEYGEEERLGIVYGCCRGEILESEKVQEFVDDMWGEREYVSDESVIFDEFVEDGCYWLLRADLDAMQLMLLERAYEIISVTHGGQERKAIACKVYNNARDSIDREGEVLHQVLLGQEACGT